MRTFASGAVAIVVLLLAAAAFAPASLLDHRVAAASGGTLRLSDATGTVWDGTGALGDAAGTWRMPVAWKVAWPSLLRGTADIALLPPPGTTHPRGTVTVSRSSVALRDVTLELPVRALASALPLRAPVTLGGVVTVIAPDFAWNGAQGRGAANVRWRDARLAAAGTVAALGIVDVALDADEQRLAGRVTNSGGDVRIEGTATLAGASLAIDAVVTPQPGAPEAITRALAVAGTPDANGAVRITWRGAAR